MRADVDLGEDLIPEAVAEQVARARAVAPLYRYLRERGISQAWMARRLGMSKQMLNNTLHGFRQPPTPDFRERAAEALGVPVSRIWTATPAKRGRRVS